MLVAGCVVYLAGQPIVGLGICSVGLGVFGLWLDRRFLPIWLVTPAMWFSSICILTGGIGPILLVVSDSAELMGVFRMQVGICVGQCVFFGVYALARSEQVPPSFRNVIVQDLRVRHSLLGAGIFCLGWAVADTIVGAVTGASDRGEAGEAAAYQFFGVWSYFGAFNRLNAVGFVLLPIIWLFGGVFVRLYSIAACAIVIGMGLLTGSRYSAFMPFVALFVGYFGFVSKPRVRLEWLALAALPVAAFMFVFLDHFRNTAAFREESLANPVSKLRAVGEARERSERLDGGGTEIVGGRLIGTVDPIIFDSTPSVIPNAGFQNVDAILWIYVPHFVYPYRPTLHDGKWIAEEYLGRLLIRTSIGPSLIGDWYRRFGWLGIGTGMAITGLFLALYLRLMMWGLSSLNFYAIALWLICTVFVLKDANMTVLTGMWWMAYDIPKQALLLWIFMKIGGPIGAILANSPASGRVPAR
jgi:hypothetical protein